jgi:hypothetical protein
VIVEALPLAQRTAVEAARSRRPHPAVHAFRTRARDDVPSVVRTRGVVLEPRHGEMLAAVDVVRHAEPIAPRDCAHGKVAVVTRRGSTTTIACWQVSSQRTDARLVACGNTAAAAIASVARGARHGDLVAELPPSGRLDLRQGALVVDLPRGGSIEVEATVTVHDGVAAVDQRWRGVAIALDDERIIGGRRCVVSRSALNDYVVVLARPGEDVRRFTLAEAVRLWTRFGLRAEPLLARLAVVAPGTEAPSTVKFFTCGDREHPSAPLTGLAVLSVAARRLAWPCLAVGRVVTAAGTVPLPRVDAVADAATITFPTRVVDLVPALPPPEARA